MTRTRVKICGITSLEDALAAVAAGADALGFVFYPASQRSIEPALAAAIIQKLPPFVQTVGLFVNEESETVNQVATACSLDMVQLHGDETAAYARTLTCRYIKALRITVADGPAPLHDFPEAAGFLVDASVAGAYGGTGSTADWQAALQVVASGRPVILAGGLNATNVAQAITVVRPYAVDVSSGVERTPGHKDPSKMLAFVAAVKDNDHESA